MTLRIALIGSRELERQAQYKKDIPICYDVAYRLAELGIIFTSGLCTDGMDGIAQKAYSQAVLDGKANTSQFEVYVAEQKNINTSPLPNKHLAIIRNPKLIPETHKMCLKVMGEAHWKRCDAWARGMHSRNCHQIFGYDLKNPVDAVVTWTPNGNVVGGTATALKLAMDAGIPIFNLGRIDQDNVKMEIRQFLLDNNVPGVR
jgi:hypothetical protein